MTRKFLRQLFRPASSRVFGLPFFFGTVAVILGTVGLAMDSPDFTPRSIALIVFAVLRSFVPQVESLRLGNWVNQTGAVFAVMATMTGTALLALAFLGEAFTKYFTRMFRTGHTVVIGDTPLADRLARAFDAQGTKVIHAVPPGAAKAADDAPRRLDFDFDAQSLIRVLALRRASKVVVDAASGAATASLGFAMLGEFDRPIKAPGLLGRLSGTVTRRQPATLALCVADTALADQFADMLERARAAPAGGLPPRLKPVFVNPNHTIARNALSRYPLFSMAARRRQSAVHAVIIGFGDFGEKLLDQILLTSLAGTLGTPHVTILDRDAARLERRFRARRPRVLDELPIRFATIDLGADPIGDEARESALKALRKAEADGGITAIYLALPTDDDTIAAALLLNRHRELTGEFAAPVFYRSRSDQAVAILPAEAPGADASTGFVRLQVDDKALLGEIAEPDSGKMLAQALHEVYRTGTGRGASPWHDLSDTLRRANVRAADHLPAKLWTLGIDVEGLAPGSLPSLTADDLQRLGIGSAQPLTPALRQSLMPLARLEHERWCIERRLDGWTHGLQRDPRRRLHPLLVPWSRLTKRRENTDKNIDQFRAAITFAMEHAARKPLR